jgi:hypothetical protein
MAGQGEQPSALKPLRLTGSAAQALTPRLGESPASLTLKINDVVQRLR